MKTLIYVLVMVATIVAVDVAFLRNHTWLRLVVNIAIVLAFGLGYVAFVKR
ncbi:hypothetical protein [Gordonia sp. (in: high G+C Gram-positive bacteria)]|uniref:hypothetical protein n=1 Tax=Gordonia sp. (in: high G+C Gram-positive bacteria) TaxID=84139 RepID=UPI0039E6106F